MLAAVAGGAVMTATEVGTAVPASGSQASPASGPAGTASPARAPAPLAVASSTPAAGSVGVDGTHPLTITFNQPVGRARPYPTISPAVPGGWSAAGDQLTFTPTGALPPASRITVTVPPGLRAAAGAVLSRAETITFITASGSVLALDEALARLHYLPLVFTPAGPVPDTPAARQRAVYRPPAGTFSWAWPSVPPALAAIWAEGRPTVMLKGAVMAFEADHGLAVDGVAGPQVWAALDSTTRVDPHGYTYALASKTRPESLTVWHDGSVVAHTAANTGIPQAPTADGTFTVYERLAHQVMRGINPDGSHYADPVSWVAYFNGGDAVHYMGRPSYGYPQSLGCVELPYRPAEAIWPYLTLGTLVTVTG